MLNITNHQRNANWNHNEILPSHLLEWLSSKRHEKTSVGINMGQRNPFTPWECKLGQPLWKIVWRFLKKIKVELPYNTTTPLLGISPKEMKTIPKRSALPCPLQHYSQWPRYGNNLSVHQQVQGWRRRGIYMLYTHTHPHIKENFIQRWKRRKSCCLWQHGWMDGPWQHYAKWNKQDRERQILDNTGWYHLYAES